MFAVTEEPVFLWEEAEIMRIEDGVTVRIHVWKHRMHVVKYIYV